MKKIQIYAFSDEAGAPLEEQIAALKRNGLAGMEIRNVDNINVSDLSKQQAKDIKEKLADNGLCVWSIGSPISKISIEDDFEGHLGKFRHTLEIAEILQAKNMRLFSFFIPKEKEADDYQTAVFERMGQFVRAAENYDITLCHENEKGIFGDKEERCLAIHKAFPTIKSVFDPANFVQCGVDTKKAWEMLKEYVHYVHIKDALADGYVVPAGKGAGNVAHIVKDYMANGGKHFTIEPHLKVFSGFAELEQGEAFKSHLSFADNHSAFDTACNSFKELIGG